MEKFNTNTVVIGAGVVGLAIAKKISAENIEEDDDKKWAFY